jgi:hypothetical protein
MLADYYRKQVLFYGHVLYDIDGSRSAEQMTDMVEAHFAQYLATMAQ